MADEDVIRRASEIAGVGYVTGPYKGKHQGGKERGKQGPGAPMWRWSVYTRADILYVLRGFWPGLGARRQSQVQKKLQEAGIPSDWFRGTTPYESRWDLMYLFATNVCFSLDDLLKEVQSLGS